MKIWKLGLCSALLAGLLLAPQTTPRAHAADALPLLHVSGTNIVDSGGKNVVLGGVNLGGWFVEEMWMMPYETKPPEGSPFAPVADHVTLWQTVEKRFGTNEMRRVRAALREAWVNQGDFDRIKAAGMNCVRIPFTFDLLNEPDGMATLDKAVAMAKQSGLYVILDLHGAPGRQSSYDHTGRADVNELFKKPENIVASEAVWSRVAAHYKDRPEVAGYDLLNEPVGAPDAVSMFVVQDRLVRAIRKEDPKHIIFVEEGYKGRTTFPQLNAVGWENVVLSWHHYNFGAKTEAEQANGMAGVDSEAQRVIAQYKAPVFMGEFQLEPNGTPKALQKGLQAWQEGGYSWTIWTYKVAMRNGGGGMWGWYHTSKAIEPLDPFKDSASELIRKSAQFRTSAMDENKDMTRVFLATAKVAPLPPNQEIAQTAQTSATVLWKYTTTTPTGNWFAPNFDASSWKEGPAGFGNKPDDIPANLARTKWDTSELYLRREFTLPEGARRFSLVVSHDDDAEIYLNGVLAATLPQYGHTYTQVPILPEALATLKPGKNLIAVHCHQGGGGQYIDVGLVGIVAK